MTPSADNAIPILDTLLKASGPGALAYWVLPNSILTLSGVRAYCDGVFWSDSKEQLERWRKEISDSLPIIGRVLPLIDSEVIIESARGHEAYARYELLTKPGLTYVLRHTGLLGKADGNAILSLKSQSAVMETFVALLRSQPGMEGFSQEELNHAAFGLWVGYPDKAILEAIPAWREDNPFAERLIDADIRGAAYYTCPQPVYQYPRHLIHDTAIHSHERLWSQILKDYYSSDFRKRLEKNRLFREKIEELGK